MHSLDHFLSIRDLDMYANLIFRTLGHAVFLIRPKRLLSETVDARVETEQQDAAPCGSL